MPDGQTPAGGNIAGFRFCKPRVVAEEPGHSPPSALARALTMPADEALVRHVALESADAGGQQGAQEASQEAEQAIELSPSVGQASAVAIPSALPSPTQKSAPVKLSDMILDMQQQFVINSNAGKSGGDEPASVPKRKPSAKGAQKLDEASFDSKLKFTGTGYKMPRHVGCSTIYTNEKGKNWRVKLQPGDKTEKKVGFGPDPKKQWAEVVTLVKKAQKK